MFTVVQLFITSFEGCIFLLTFEQKQEIHNGTNIRYSGIYNKYQLSYRNIEEKFRNDQSLTRRMHIYIYICIYNDK